MTGEIENPATYPNLRGRSVFISGGGSGIGASLVSHFAAQGAGVPFVDVAKEASEELVAELADSAIPPHFIQCDLRDTDQLDAAIKAAGERHGPITVLVNRASSSMAAGSELGRK